MEFFFKGVVLSYSDLESLLSVLPKEVQILILSFRSEPIFVYFYRGSRDFTLCLSHKHISYFSVAYFHKQNKNNKKKKRKITCSK